ncbi:MAG: DUF359 domain-containing protein [Candidatus Altiarchaeales archaeon]|nr:DUF359 domain-containing protein [Candidatus Altiarchaeales archaeon]
MRSKTLKLPNSLREKLKEPFGELLVGLEGVRHNKNIICVGDETSKIALEFGLKPKVLVYDGKIKRESVSIPAIIRDFKATEVRITNPAGYITSESFEAIYTGVTGFGRVKIRVDGEEDLLTIAAIDLAPAGSVVLYGQPHEGLVVVKVNEESKKRAKKVLEQMNIEKNEH